MPLGEAIAVFFSEVLFHGFLDGMSGLLRRLGALVLSLIVPKLTYSTALRGSWNRRVGALVLLLLGLVLAALS
ncbi:MAG: hypothetical protein R2817_10175 [Flavobacteriales bacterium]